MKIPESLIQSLHDTKDFNEEAFRQIHETEERITSIRVNPQKNNNPNFEHIQSAISWTDYGYYLSERPSFTFDPLFHAGCYYVQDASSMFLEQALRQTVDLSKPIKILDLCAAPGGKSTHLQSLISAESLLVSNDAIKQRANILKDNIIKWGCSNVMVTNNDPKDFLKLKGYFDVIVVDAPCSGSGLFRKDAEAINEWSENNVILCGHRQQRIIADVLPSLKENGVLIYSTCSYSKEENEDMVDWMTNHLELENIPLSINADWGISEVITKKKNYGYRFWPYRVKGEGFFLSVFQNQSSPPFKNKTTSKKIKAATSQLSSMIEHWLLTDNVELIKVNNTIYAWRYKQFGDFDYLLQQLRVIYSGILLGEMVHDKLIPHHALAMSPLISPNVSKVSIDRAAAIAYLQKKDITIPETNSGWQLITYNQHPLGWIKVLPNRINNYYPKELRILKDL